MDSGKLCAYLRHGQHLVKGWLSPGAGEAILLLSEEQRRAGVAGGVAEIGVHHGKLFILLYLLGEEGEPAVAIDLFSKQELNVDRSGAGDLDVFRRNLARHADLSRLTVHEGDSTLLDAAKLRVLGRGPLRMVSIDGGHTAEITAHDLATAEGALAEGGIVILDDAFNEMWPGVMDGIHRHLAGSQAIVPFAIGANKTFFCQPGCAACYARTLRTLEARIVDQVFLGHPALCFEFTPRTLGAWYRRVDPWRAVRRGYHGLMGR